MFYSASDRHADSNWYSALRASETAMGISSSCVKFVSGCTHLGPPARWFFGMFAGRARSPTNVRIISVSGNHVRQTGNTSGGRPQTALSGGGDPTERHAPKRQECHWSRRRCGSSHRFRTGPHFCLLLRYSSGPRRQATSRRLHWRLDGCARSCNTPATILAS